MLRCDGPDSCSHLHPLHQQHLQSDSAPRSVQRSGCTISRHTLLYVEIPCSSSVSKHWQRACTLRRLAPQADVCLSILGAACNVTLGVAAFNLPANPEIDTSRDATPLSTAVAQVIMPSIALRRREADACCMHAELQPQANTTCTSLCGRAAHTSTSGMGTCGRLMCAPEAHTIEMALWCLQCRLRMPAHATHFRHSGLAGESHNLGKETVDLMAHSGTCTKLRERAVCC